MSILKSLNEASEKYWFRLLNSQPRQVKSELRKKFTQEEEKSLLFVTAYDMTSHAFVDKAAVEEIIR